MFAATQISKGSAESAVVAGVDEMNDITFSVLDRIGALAHAAGDLDEACRPFDRRRNGMTVGEGGAVLLLGDPAPGTRAYAAVSGFGIARDSTATVSDWGEGHEAVARAMAHAIEDAEITLRDIDAIFASANGTIRADRLEYRAIQALYGSAAPPVVATKGTFGEYAASGALQLASAVLALREQTLWKSAGFEEGEHGMTIAVNRELRPADLRHVLVNSISAGGGVISAVLSRWNGAD
jgi:3-oxoacyl-[acyl-carrier-protein] synthase II